MRSGWLEVNNKLIRLSLEKGMNNMSENQMNNNSDEEEINKKWYYRGFIALGIAVILPFLIIF